MKMNSKIVVKAATYRLQRITTPEDLKMKIIHGGRAILTFGDRILVAGYCYNPDGRSYCGATYRFTTAGHTCEGRVELVSISEDTFEDNGHAIAWAMAHWGGAGNDEAEEDRKQDRPLADRDGDGRTDGVRFVPGGLQGAGAGDLQPLGATGPAPALRPH